MVIEDSADQIRIIAAHAGTGKSYLAKLYPDRFIDLYLLSGDGQVRKKDSNEAP